MKKRTKYIVQHLPYDLKIKILNKTGELIGVVLDRAICKVSTVEYNISIDNIEPILKPLSDIEKDFEFKGEIINAITKLHYKSYIMVGSKARKEPSIEYYGHRAILTTQKMISDLGVEIHLNQMNKNLYWINRQLLEWGFDVFGINETN